MGDLIVFWVTAPISVLAAGAMVLARNAVHAALLLVLNFITLAVFFVALGAPFLAVVQIIVYAGAIMVLFLFVIMLLGVDREVPLTEQIRAQRWVAIGLGVALIAEIVTAVRLGIGLSRHAVPDLDIVNRGGHVQSIAKLLFNSYYFPFELTSVLLIVAAVGAMLHGRRRIEAEDEDDVAAEPVDAADTEPVAT